MSDINWDSVATAGATAALVTWAFEYLAKPRLEARKERILDAYRSRRELTSSLLSVAACATRYIAISSVEDPVASMAAERDRQFQRMIDLSKEMLDGAERHAGTWGNFGAGTVTGLVTALYVRLTITEDDKRLETAERVKELSLLAFTGFNHPRLWELPSCLRAHMKLRYVVSELTGVHVGPNWTRPRNT